MMAVVAVVEEKLEGESTTDVRLRFPPRSTEPPTCLRFSTRCPSTSNVRLPTGASLLTSFSHFFHFPNTESLSTECAKVFSLQLNFPSLPTRCSEIFQNGSKYGRKLQWEELGGGQRLLSQHSSLETSSGSSIILRWGAKITAERLLDKAKLQRVG